mmetsp:Transcript_64040/g.169629  ORF Transcript_64040/g.169629 Transcript_64040/m.169629 type:complete len:127 (-) Transcript_64040:212-592(-)
MKMRSQDHRSRVAWKRNSPAAAPPSPVAAGTTAALAATAAAATLSTAAATPGSTLTAGSTATTTAGAAATTTIFASCATHALQKELSAPNFCITGLTRHERWSTFVAFLRIDGEAVDDDFVGLDRG